MLLLFQARKIADQAYSVAVSTVEGPSMTSYSEGPSQHRPHVRRQVREMRMFRMAGFLLGYFTLSWLPFTIYEFSCILTDCSVSEYVS